MYCIKCGKKLENGMIYCPRCGEKSDYKTPKEVVKTAPVVNSKQKVIEDENVSDKSRLAAGLFGIFLGGFGVHNFYLNYTAKGVVQVCLFGVGLLLTLTIIGSIIGIPMIMASSIWGLVDGILIISNSTKIDGNGRPIPLL